MTLGTVLGSTSLYIKPPAFEDIYFHPVVSEASKGCIRNTNQLFNTNHLFNTTPLHNTNHLYH